MTVVESEPYFIFNTEEILPIHQFCLILMRKDPPVDQTYVYATQLLSQVTAKTLVINDPHALANLNEKLIVSYFSTWAPPTLVTSNPAEIGLFLKTHRGTAVLKSLSGFAGRDVKKIKENDPETASLIDKMTQGGQRPVMVQPYLPEIEKGEKRIFMIDGNPLGTLLRIPPRGGFITNPDLGGDIKATGLTQKEKKLCATLSPFLKKNKIFFAGVDVIGEKLIEINITSPGFLWELNEVDHKNYERDIIDCLEEKLT